MELPGPILTEVEFDVKVNVGDDLFGFCVGVGEGVGDGVRVGVGDGEAVGVVVGVGDGEGDGVGVGVEVFNA
jgi:hypothetical protein